MFSLCFVAVGTGGTHPPWAVPRGDAPNRTHSSPEHFTAEQQQLFAEPGHADIFQKLRVRLNVNRFPDRSKNIICDMSVSCALCKASRLLLRTGTPELFKKRKLMKLNKNRVYLFLILLSKMAEQL